MAYLRAILCGLVILSGATAPAHAAGLVDPPSLAEQVAAGKLPAIAVKLKGVKAKIKPSKARYSVRFQIPVELLGC